LPDWVEEGKEPDPSLRDVEGKVEYDAQRVIPAGERLDTAVRDNRMIAGSPSKANGSGTPTGKEKTLDDWFAESEEDSDEEESDEDVEETDEESSEEGSEEEDDESDDNMEHDRLVK
jgi:hypothetical protein